MMKKFAGNMILCGAAFAMTAILTASQAQAQVGHHPKPKMEPYKIHPVQVHDTRALPQKKIASPQQHHGVTFRGTAIKPNAATHGKPNTAAPIHQVPAKVPHMIPAPARPIVSAQPKIIVIEQPRRTLLEKFLDKIF